MQDSSIYEEAGPAGARVAIARSDILAEITNICNPRTPIEDDEVTIGQVAEKWGYSVSTAQTVLDKAVDAGQLTRRKALNSESGRECWAYRVVS